MDAEDTASRALMGEIEGRGRFPITIRIGRPYQVNDVDWACPVAVEGIDRRHPDMHGVDSWQSLQLAISLVRGRLEHFIERGGKLYWPAETSAETSLDDIFGRDT